MRNYGRKEGRKREKGWDAGGGGQKEDGLCHYFVDCSWGEGVQTCDVLLRGLHSAVNGHNLWHFHINKCRPITRPSKFHEGTSRRLAPLKDTFYASDLFRTTTGLEPATVGVIHTHTHKDSPGARSEPQEGVLREGDAHGSSLSAEGT